MFESNFKNKILCVCVCIYIYIYIYIIFMVFIGLVAMTLPYPSCQRMASATVSVDCLKAP